MTNTTNTDAARTATLAKLTAARRRMASFIMAQTSTKLEPDAIIDHRGNIVVGGKPSEVAVVAAYMTTVLGIEGVTVDELDPEDPELTFCRIPESQLQPALARLAGGAK